MLKGQFYASGNDKLQLNSRERTNVNTLFKHFQYVKSDLSVQIPTRTVLRYLELILYIKKPLYFLAYVFFF